MSTPVLEFVVENRAWRDDIRVGGTWDYLVDI